MNPPSADTKEDLRERTGESITLTPATVMRYAKWWVATTILAAVATPAWASHSCNASRSVVLSPSPAQIYISGGLDVGGAVYTGSLVATYSCNFSAPLGAWDDFVLVGSTSPASIAGTTFQVVRDGTPTMVTLNGGCGFGPPQDWPANGVTSWTPTSAGTGICQFRATMPIRIVNAGTPPTGSAIPADPGIFGDTPGWSAFDQPNTAGTYYSRSIVPIPIYIVTCTVSPTNLTVVLPTLPTTDFASAGSVGGETPFTITLSGCNHSGSNYVATAVWDFLSDPMSTSVIANTASSSPATNVGVQMLTASNVPIADGDATVIATVTGGGSYSAGFKARYYATGAATAGQVRAVATFTVSYE